MNNVVITGIKTTIAKEFEQFTDDEVTGIRTEDIGEHLDADRYLFCHGLLYSKTSLFQTEEERAASMYANYTSVVDCVDRIVATNQRARICIVGSHSGYKGSYDDTYALTKALIHQYIERKVLTSPAQQLVGVAPSIIEDSGMTTRRTDLDNLDATREQHPMKRFLTAKEVAEMAYYLLYHQPYVNRTVVRMHGGNV